MSQVAVKQIHRRDGHEKLIGTATYSAEWPVAGALHAVPVVATIAHGRVADVDITIAQEMPGVRLILTVMDAPTVKEAPVFGESDDPTAAAAQSIGPLQSRDIVHACQYVAVVVADTIENATQAAREVAVKYDRKSSQTDYLAPELSTEEVDKVLGKPARVTIGDPEAALADAEFAIDCTYSTAPNHHNPMEPHATLAVFEKNEKGKSKLTVYDSSQSLVYLKKSLAKQFEIAEADVRIICPFVGGAFGCKGAAWPHVALAILAAREADAPVKLVMQREHMYGGIGHRSPTKQRVALGAQRDGKLTAYIHEGRSQASILNSFVEPFTVASHHMYAAENRKYSQHYSRINTQNPTFMRAPGEVTGMFAIECAIDEMASHLEMDPIAFRLKNEPASDPTTGQPFSARLLPDCLQKGAELFGWDQRQSSPRQQREGHWLIGTGVAAASFPVNHWPCTVRVTIDADSKVLIESATQELGTGTTTAQCQFAASLFGVPPQDVRMELGDTVLPPGSISGGSGTTASTAEAIKHAADELKRELVMLIDRGSPLYKLKPDEFEYRDGKLVVAKSGEGVSLAKMVAAAPDHKIRVEGKCSPDPTSQKFSAHSFGAQFCEVAVDEDFGLVRVRRLLGYFAGGRMMNANTARSQLLGGMVMGIGQALLEETHWDHRHGRITNNDLASYWIPTNADIPPIDVHWNDEPDFNATITGAKGIGEIGITGVAAAIANAVFHATGKRVRDLPITPERLMA